MLPLFGRPLAGRVLERLKRCQRPDLIVLATTTKPEDDVLAQLAEDYRVVTFRGAENDLVDRYYQAARRYGADIVVRVPADNPVPEPAEVDRIIAYHLASGNDFSSNYPNVFANGYPDGIGAEVYGMAALRQVWETPSDPRHREHPHTNFYEQADGFKIGTIQCPAEFRRPDIVLDVNTRDEYVFLAALYDYLYPRNPRFSILDIIRWYDDVYRPAPPRPDAG
jgi:spore coat polysaccharide biosynthesis protein SpsF